MGTFLYSFGEALSKFVVCLMLAILAAIAVAVAVHLFRSGDLIDGALAAFAGIMLAVLLYISGRDALGGPSGFVIE